jgi:hypothetical protein
MGAMGLSYEKLTEAPPSPGTEAAKTVLESLRPHPDSARIHTTPYPRIPEVNKLGIVIRPVKASFDKQKLTPWQIEHGINETEHHLYWPKSVFVKAGSLAKEFRELEVNRENYPNFQHIRLHRRCDPFIMKYPTYLIPPKDVMETGIDEARNLKLLGVQINSLDSILGGLDDLSKEAEEEIAEKKEMISFLCARVVCSEIIYPTHVQEVVSRARRYVPDQFKR